MRLDDDRMILDKFKVSIHAPTWGATENAKEFEALNNVSIHAPTWGATRGADSEDG